MLKPPKSADVTALAKDLHVKFECRFMKLEDWVRAVKMIGCYVGARSKSGAK